jgi:Mrp family chromosome partitioning ATPase
MNESQKAVMMPTKKQALETLSNVMDPELGKNIVELGMVRNLKIFPDGKVSFTLTLTVAGCPMRQQMADDARKALLALQDVKSVEIVFGQMTAEERQKLFETVRPKLPKLTDFNDVKRVIAVMSGKGGVGKSSVAALLAVAARNQCLTSGILDADVTGPSIPRLFGLPSGGLAQGEQGILPAYTSSGIKIMSTNLLIPDEDLPVVWRGPLISSAITQFWQDTLWGKLDILFVDMPPGTSDAALTVMQKLPLDGIVLVTTPQSLAGMVVRKALHLAQQLNIPILGLVENMSFFQCPDTGKEYAVFGPSHAQEVASMAGIDSWVRLPIDPEITLKCDQGRAEEVKLSQLESLVVQLAAQPEKE